VVIAPATFVIRRPARGGMAAVETSVATETTGALPCARVSIPTNAPGQDHRFTHVVVWLGTRAVNMECENHSFAGIARAMP